MLKLVHAVKSPWFGVNFDSGNFRSDDPYRDLARIAPYAVNVQIKVVVSRAGKREESDYPRLAAMLRDAGYRGYIVLEYEEAGDIRAECKKHLELLREAFA
jgi:sugar phosphate isomerase/epimerase